jgi:putative ATP-binding cassette transporter
MRILSFLLQYSRTRMGFAVLAAVLSGASNTLILATLNRSLSGGAGAAARGWMWVFFGLCLMVPLLRVVSELMLIHLGQDTVCKLRLDLSRRLLGLPLRRLEEMGSHRILSTLTEDVPNITNSVTLIPILCFNISVLVGGFVYLLVLSRSAFFATLGLVLLGILTYQVPILRANRHFHQARRTSDDLYDHFRSLTLGMKELKLHRQRRSAFLRDSLERTSLAVRDQNVRGFSIYAVATSWGQGLLFAIVGLIVYVLPSVAVVSRETLIGYSLVFLFLMTPLQMVMNALPALGRSDVALGRIEQLGLALSESAECESEGPTPVSWHRLELIGVTHVYRREGEDRDFVLGPIDLELRPGELAFLTGGNGSGKTTLAKVMTGLYAPERGEIRLDGRSISDVERDGYRGLFSAVFADFHLFDSLLGLEGTALDARARDVLAMLELDHLVKVRDRAISTTELSQGQRKRLALLTAYLEDRPIYLFDEWAADQDPAFKEVFYLLLLPELKRKGKTVVVISHDESYYDVADRIIKLDYGRIESDRPHVPHLGALRSEGAVAIADGP